MRSALLRAGYDGAAVAGQLRLARARRAHRGFAEHCLDKKVVVRPFHPEGVRVTVSTPEENDALLAAALSFAR